MLKHVSDVKLHVHTRTCSTNRYMYASTTNPPNDIIAKSY